MSQKLQRETHYKRVPVLYCKWEKEKRKRKREKKRKEKEKQKQKNYEFSLKYLNYQRIHHNMYITSTFPKHVFKRCIDILLFSNIILKIILPKTQMIGKC